MPGNDTRIDDGNRNVLMLATGIQRISTSLQ